MMDQAVRDPLLDKLPAVAPPVVEAPPVAAPAPVAPVVAPTAAPAADAAPTLFNHLADPPVAAAPAIEPHKVKTTTIKSDPSALETAIANASGLSKAELPTAKTTTGNVLEQAGEAGVTNLNQVAYILATARRESHMGNWMNEFGGNSYFEQHYGSKTKKGRELGNTGAHDGANFHGRGLVQITGRTNYTKWDHNLEKEGFEHDGKPVDIVNHPEQAALPDVAARIAVEGMRDAGFTKYKLDDYINDKKTDYLGARRIINGQDHAQEIATQATSFQHQLEAHAGDYADAIIAGQNKGLPIAHGGTLTAPTFDSSMMSGTPDSTSQKFVRADKLLQGNIGRFTPAEAPKHLDILKTHPVQENG